MTACRCGCTAPGGDAVHLVAAALAEGDLDRAMELGLVDMAPCAGCDAACTAMVLTARDARRTALAARDRYRARGLRLQRRAAEHAARRMPKPDAPGKAAPALPPAAADALARALAKARVKR